MWGWEITTSLKIYLMEYYSIFKYYSISRDGVIESFLVYCEVDIEICSSFARTWLNHGHGCLP